MTNDEMSGIYNDNLDRMMTYITTHCNDLTSDSRVVEYAAMSVIDDGIRAFPYPNPDWHKWDLYHTNIQAPYPEDVWKLHSYNPNHRGCNGADLEAMIRNTVRRGRRMYE